MRRNTTTRTAKRIATASRHNLSWNFGVEGPTADPAILELRRRQRRNFLLTLFTSQGVPMLSGGDELGRSQHGNNNAYCHDSPLSWTLWDLPDEEMAFLRFVAQLGTLRARQPVLRRRTFLRGRRLGFTDVLWLRPEGGEMTEADWRDANRRAIGMLLDGEAILERNETGTVVVGDTVLVILNAHSESVPFVLPDRPGTTRWARRLDTAEPDGPERHLSPGNEVSLPARSAAIYVGNGA